MGSLDQPDNAGGSPSDHSCGGSDDERYSSADSFLGSASACSSFGSRREYFDASRSLSFGDEQISLSGRNLFGGEGILDGVGAESRGSHDERTFRGRLDSLPRIRTKVAEWGQRKQCAGTEVEHSEKPPISPEGHGGGASFEDANSEQLPGIVSSTSKRGLEARDDRVIEIDVWDECDLHSRGSAAVSDYLDPSDTSIKVVSGPNAGLSGKLGGSSAAAEKDDMLHSDGCFCGSMSRKIVSSDLYDSIVVSPTFDPSSPIQKSAIIDKIEVVGARHKKGDVSFGERLIGVKEYVVYRLKVQYGDNQWEVERRYHDFFLLYCQLKVLFFDHGLRLPPPWLKVPNESRKIFGNASPTVIKERSILIQDCLQSILTARTPLGTPSCLIWFLSPVNSLCNRKFPTDNLPSYSDSIQLSSTLEKNMPLVMELRVHKSKKELLKEQGFTCAGCNQYLNSRMSPIEELMQILGWGKFQVCEFTGQIFCSSCHANETAVLPARVLHHWDFSLYPVCNAAKTFLDSIYNQPILCISAVNPFLFLKVSYLFSIVNLRKKIGALLHYIRCPFWRYIEMHFGSRKYLLEAVDIFSLRDLVDLSKGVFAELPASLGNLMEKIQDHIMNQCSVCYELGIPCAAQKACREFSPIMFPLQEAGSIRCTSCGLIYHEACFKYLAMCQCGKSSSVNRMVGSLGMRDPGAEIELHGVVDSPSKSFYEQSSSYISELISKARPDFQWVPRNSRLLVTRNNLLDAFS